MNVRVFRTADEAAHAAASAVAAQLARKRASVLGLLTGRTSLEVYEELARLHEAGEADFSLAHTFNIDEFVGLASNDERSYCAFMQQHLFSRINLSGSQVHLLDGATGNPAQECARFCLIATGPSKARAVASMFTGRISTGQPASLLQLHSNVEVILDLAAAEKLPESGFDAKP